MPEQTPYEKLAKANDDYHEAVQEAMLDSEVDVELKVRFASAVENVFDAMQQANDVLKEHYEPEEE